MLKLIFSQSNDYVFPEHAAKRKHFHTFFAMGYVLLLYKMTCFMGPKACDAMNSLGSSATFLSSFFNFFGSRHSVNLFPFLMGAQFQF